MHRRNWLAQFFGAIAAVGCVVGVAETHAQEQQQITLHDRLRAGLKCRRPEEFEFVAHVAELVENNTLSPELVLSTYRWAVKQRPNFPFFYFQYALKQRAAALGVDL
ncbi:hypothetical protein [Anatilimnocola floriformis]|uniref:hypothetical protein n=1 Tax=Anatilimnocola floriformis TaxID=2948575 RepID=UPI0020C38C03|nr:hypothetical protein [Anatilimnocola floriformis]